MDNNENLVVGKPLLAELADTRPGWGYPHAPRGTCLLGCPSYGWCHCGCGTRPKQSEVTYATGSRYRGRPYVFVPGHHLRVVHPRAGMWSKNGVAVEKVRPLVFWLRERHGTMRAVADMGRHTGIDAPGLRVQHQAQASAARGSEEDRRSYWPTASRATPWIRGRKSRGFATWRRSPPSSPRRPHQSREGLRTLSGCYRPDSGGPDARKGRWMLVGQPRREGVA